MKKLEDILAVMKVLDGREESTWWYVDGNDDAHCLLNANDLFYWACADAEPVVAEDLPLLKQSWEDCKKLLKSERRFDWDTHGLTLFICRKRGMRPQRPCYRTIPEELRILFDAAGPPRDPKDEG